MGRAKDLTGMKFGRLTVIKQDGKDKWGAKKWLCKCDCGNIISVIGKSLTNNNTKSCGCYKKEKTSKRNKKDITNKRFGKLVAIKPLRIDENNQVIWLCKCDCGNEINVATHSLLSGNTKSCGCTRKEKLAKINIERWENEEYRNNMINTLTSAWNEERREQQAQIMHDRWEDDDFRNANTGNNHYKYNSNLTEDDRKGRIHDKQFTEWSKQVKIKGEYVCDCCNKKDGGHLVSHHLNSWDNNIEQRYDVENGVCLCEHCHKEFHHIYGYGNNTKEQYIEFKENKNKGEM